MRSLPQARTNRHQDSTPGEARRLDADPEYTVWNVAHSYGKTATFMPKLSSGDKRIGHATCTSRCGKAARTCSQATATQTFGLRALLHRGIISTRKR